MVNKDVTVALLSEKINFIDTLLEKEDFGMLRQWKQETLMILDNLISETSKYYKNFEDISFRPGSYTFDDEEENMSRTRSAYKEGLEQARSSLKAVVFGLEKGLFD